MRLNPVLAQLRPYPFLVLDEARKRALARGVRLIDFSVGDPMEETDPGIRQALVDALGERSSYPKAAGLDEHKQAIAAWIERRYGVQVDWRTEVMPTFGSKEAVYSFAFIVMDPHSPKNIVVVTEPGYPIPDRGAEMAGGRVLRLPLLEENHFLPDLSAIPDATWDEVALLWVNYPNNPTAAMAPLSFYEQLAAKAARHDFIVASDEAYSEIYFGAPTSSALQVGDRSHMAVFNTQSKRSSMTGYRSGFIVAHPEIIRGLALYRPLAGVAVPEFIQHATIEALSRENHVERMRGIYAAKRELFLEFFQSKGIRVAGAEATFYLWCEVPGGQTAQEFASALLEEGVVVAPGNYFGDSGEGFVRIALVPTLEECQAAIAILDRVL
ncbi:MAG TPA: aminotransferase class I/II-fold pyridoxal phosphate-dependent enzyme [Candidatus Nitrosotalea sp.]|nr:aminotransferase class I/II-fold pyridoxal phosphate-dependent enzyme [Candidatus Nitrosotalea sp.]